MQGGQAFAHLAQTQLATIAVRGAGIKAPPVVTDDDVQPAVDLPCTHMHRGCIRMFGYIGQRFLHNAKTNGLKLGRQKRREAAEIDLRFPPLLLTKFHNIMMQATDKT